MLHKAPSGFFGFKDSNLVRFSELKYQSTSHAFNKAVAASYYNVQKYGFVDAGPYIEIAQSKRSVILALNDSFSVLEHARLMSEKKALILSEQPVFKKKSKEVCYDLADIFSKETPETSRGIKFAKRDGVAITDYNSVDKVLDSIYNGWKETKETDGKTFLIAFNPARYYRSYCLKSLGYNVYQKLISVKGEPYALINFALDEDRAYELSFLSLFKEKRLKLVNDQNSLIIVGALYDLYKNYGIKYVNLGTAAGIKGLSFFKRKLPFYENIVYSN